MRRCAVCGGSLDGRRANAKYCSDAHRVAACRARKRAQEATNAADSAPAPDRAAVTPGGALVTLRAVQVDGGDFLEPLCPDPLRCRHYMRFASGPWTCEYCHPRVGGNSVAAG